MLKVRKYTVRLVKEAEYNYKAIDGKKAFNPEAVAKFLDQVLQLNLRTQESLILITVDVKNNITGVFEVSTGGISSSIVHPRDVFQRAILNNAAAIILGHNHPSGDTTPSADDIDITAKIAKGGKLLGIDLVDHIIVGGDEYYSFKEHNEY